MCQNRHITSRHQIKQRGLKSRRWYMARQFDESVSRLSNRQEVTAPKAVHPTGGEVHIGPGNETKFNVFPNEFSLKFNDSVANFHAGIGVDPRHDVRSTRDNGDAIGDVRSRHGERCLEIRCAIIQARQDMAMKIDHQNVLL